jgi:hypothetical protein
MLWSYARAGKSHPELLSKVGDHIVSMNDLRRFKPQDFSNIVRAYATSGKSHLLLFQKLTDAAIARCNNFKPQELSNLFWAYAAVGLIDQNLFTSFAPAVKSIMGHCNCQNVSNIAWAYAVANVNDPLLFNIDFIDALQEKMDDFVPENLLQLHQWQLWQNELKSGINLPPALRKKCHQAFELQLPQTSNLQNDVISVFSSIGMSVGRLSRRSCLACKPDSS